MNENLPTTEVVKTTNHVIEAIDKFECFTRNLNELAQKLQMSIEDENGNPKKMELTEWVKIVQSVWDEAKDISSECLGTPINVEFGDSFTAVIARTVLASIGLRI
jgi:uncharacterized protein Yka (UPF0111/DUF47 family)